MDEAGRALYIGGGLFWNAFWALAFGYAFSSLIQVLVPREDHREIPRTRRRHSCI